MATARQYPLLAGLRRQLVSHGEVLRAHLHLAGRRVPRVRVVLREALVLLRERRAQGRALLVRLVLHVLLVLLLLLVLLVLLLAVDAYRRQVEGRQVHVGALGRAVGLRARLALGRGVRVGGHLR